MDDIDLVREYATRNSEEAFANLVSRYINLVYSAALRQVGDPHQAEEITQAVFIILAKKSSRLRSGTILSGWLYQTARLTAANYVRSEVRRHHREQEAQMQSLLNETEPDVWTQIAPLLDQAMANLGESDRNAIVLRFFDAKNFKEVGVALGTSEDAAKMRVCRAVEKLRTFFAQRGVAISSAVLCGAVAANAVQGAPLGLAASVTTAAVTGSTVTASTLTFVKGTLKIMAWTKAKSAAVVSAGVLFAAGTATVTVKEIQRHKTYPWQVQNVDTRVLNQVPPQVRIVPTKFPQGGGWGKSNEKVLGISQPVQTILLVAYGGLSPYRLIMRAKLPQGKFDFIANLPKNSEKALQAVVKKQFGLSARHETRPMDVLRLTVKRPDAEGLMPSEVEGGSSRTGPGAFSCVNQPLSCLTGFLEHHLEIPVIDQTGLTDRFDIDLTWEPPNGQQKKRDAMKQLLLDDLGLELVPARESIDMLIVEPAK